jgi:transposase
LEIAFIDESAFYLLPSVVRTYAPCGLTPVLAVPLSYDHLSVISAITLSGKLYFDLQKDAYTGEDVVQFLKSLRCKSGKRFLIIWDGAPIHTGQAIKAYLKGGAARYYHLERLPGYAPELNPDEGVWNHLKRVELGNVCCANLKELADQIKQGVTRLRRKPQALLGCLKQVPYIV